MKTIAEMSTAILEAEGVRSRHDGVHQMASYVTALTLCRGVKELDQWLPPPLARIFDATMVKVRIVNCTGFAPR